MAQGNPEHTRRVRLNSRHRENRRVVPSQPVAHLARAVCASPRQIATGRRSRLPRRLFPLLSSLLSAVSPGKTLLQAVHAVSAVFLAPLSCMYTPAQSLGACGGSSLQLAAARKLRSFLRAYLLTLREENLGLGDEKDAFVETEVTLSMDCV